MKPLVPLDDDHELWLLLRQATLLLAEVRSKELHQYGITTMQASVALIIDGLEGKVTPGLISQWLLRKPHTVSGILARMQKQGLVNKTKDLKRKGMVNVTLTEKGHEAYMQSLKRKPMRAILSCLSEEEHQQLLSSLRKLRDKAFKHLNTAEEILFP